MTVSETEPPRERNQETEVLEDVHASDTDHQEITRETDTANTVAAHKTENAEEKNPAEATVPSARDQPSLPNAQILGYPVKIDTTRAILVQNHLLIQKNEKQEIQIHPQQNGQSNVLKVA